MTELQAVRVFREGEPVVEYIGNLISLGKSPKKAAATRTENNFNFYFRCEGHQYW